MLCSYRNIKKRTPIWSPLIRQIDDLLGEIFTRLAEEPTAIVAKPMRATALPTDFVFEGLIS